MDTQRRTVAHMLTVDEVAERLHCSRRTVFRLLYARAFPSTKVGRERRVTVEDVDAYLEALRSS